jgi:ADP-ribose pyrophosphatase YjhB (NUDIX family)
MPADNREHEPDWLRWARRLAAIAQIGLTFATDIYDRERYEELRGIAAKMLARGAGSPIEAILPILAAEHDYATPKIDVRGVVFRDGEILMAREAADGGWTLPGGWADINSSPSENVEREVWEETGFRVRATKLLAVYDRARHPHAPPFPFHIYKMFFLCELTGGEATISHETDAIAFFSRDAMPPFSISRLTPGQFDRMFDHHGHPDWPTDFD